MRKPDSNKDSPKDPRANSEDPNKGKGKSGNLKKPLWQKGPQKRMNIPSGKNEKEKLQNQPPFRRKAVPERNPGLQEPSAILEVDWDKGR